VTDPTGRVFDALRDNRRYVPEAPASRDGHGDRLAAPSSVTRQAVAKHLAALNQADSESRREGRERSIS
jgi:hypothetical protein